MITTPSLDPNARRAASARGVSIIICTRGRSNDLKATLESLSQAEVPAGWDIELLVVENGAPERAEALLGGFQHARLRARYLHEPAPGKSRALNCAIAASGGDVLLFTDDDIRFPREWIERMCEPIFSGRAMAVAGGVRLAPHLLRPWMNHTHRACLASTADYLSATAPSEMCGANMAVHRRVFDQIGGFDPELGPGVTNGGEESLLSWQILAAGHRIESALSVEVEHHLDRSRLNYATWVRAATLQGYSRAYLAHHWRHERTSWPRLRALYFQTKLALRRACSRHRRPDEEGIEPWEFSYRLDLARHRRLAMEQRRPRNYTRLGLRKLPSPIPQTQS